MSLVGTNPGNHEYYSVVRKEVMDLLPPRAKKVLDVGCGYGVTSAHLKRIGRAEHTFGVEFEPAAALEAGKQLDKVWQWDLNAERIIPPGLKQEQFDLVLCLHVLEHLIDPWSILRQLHEVTVPGGRLVAAVPNIRHFRTLFPLFFRGEFNYSDAGTMDAGHIRFFTKKSFCTMVEKAGFRILKVEDQGCDPGTKARAFDQLTFGCFREFLDYQYMISAEKV